MKHGFPAVALGAVVFLLVAAHLVALDLVRISFALPVAVVAGAAAAAVALHLLAAWSRRGSRRRTD